MKTKLCTYCNKPYQPLPANFKRSKYCSRTCRDQARTTRLTKICEICGHPFEVQQCQKDRRFCSETCYGQSKVTLVKRTCETCGKTFEVNAARAQHARHCSKACQTTKVELICTYCGKAFYERRSHVHYRQTCSRSCLARLKAQEGRSPLQGRERPDEERRILSEKIHQYFQANPEKHNWYIDGSYANGQLRRGPSWEVQRKVARERDNHTCQVCGKTKEQEGKNLAVHHIKAYRTFANSDEANALENLLTVCQSCHMKLEHLRA